MTHSSRLNYKAKWQAAINNKNGAPTEEVQGLISDTERIVGAEIQAAVGLKKVSGVLMSAADEARNLVNLMDEGASVGDLEFASTSQSIDLKLSENDFLLISRRLRDVLRMATARIGILTEAYEDSHTALDKIKQAHHSVRSQSSILQESIANTLMVGRGATQQECEAFVRSARTDKDYNRFDLDYEDLDSDWEDEIFKKGSLTKTNGSSIPNSTPKSEGRIVPASPKDRRVVRNGQPLSKEIEFE